MFSNRPPPTVYLRKIISEKNPDRVTQRRTLSTHLPIRSLISSFLRSRWKGKNRRKSGRVSWIYCMIYCLCAFYIITRKCEWNLNSKTLRTSPPTLNTGYKTAKDIMGDDQPPMTHCRSQTLRRILITHRRRNQRIWTNLIRFLSRCHQFANHLPRYSLRSRLRWPTPPPRRGCAQIPRVLPSDCRASVRWWALGERRMSSEPDANRKPRLLCILVGAIS